MTEYVSERRTNPSWRMMRLTITAAMAGALRLPLLTEQNKASGTLRHTLCSAGFITIMRGIRFLVHTTTVTRDNSAIIA
jgi:hypothetical protein